MISFCVLATSAVIVARAQPAIDPAAPHAPTSAVESSLGHAGDIPAASGDGRTPVADAPVLTAGAGSPSAGDTGVISYPVSAFAAMAPATALDMIQRLPGFTFNGGAAVRGFDAAAGNVLIDGARPTSKTDDLNAALLRVPAGQVERIDVIRGGAPGVDMQGFSVIANVIRRKAAASTVVAAFSNQYVASDGRQAPGVRLEGSRRWDGRLAEASLVATGTLDIGAGDGTRIRRNSAARVIAAASNKTEGDGTQIVSTGAYEQPLLGGRLRVNGQLLGVRSTGDDRAEQLGAAYYPLQIQRQRQNREESELGASYSRDLTSALRLDVLVLQQLKGEDTFVRFQTPGETDLFREQHLQGESIGRAVATWRASRRLTVEAGGEGAFNFLTGHSSLRVNDAGVPLPSGQVDVSELRGEGFVKASWTLSRTLIAEAAFRLEASHIASNGSVVLGNTFVFPKPRLSLTWSPTAADQFRFRVEQQVGQLDFADFTASASFTTGLILQGNPNLSPQQSLILEGAYERRFLGDGAVTLTLRHSQLTDVIDRAPIFAATGVFDAPANIGGGFKDELIVNASLPLSRLGLAGFLVKPYATLVRDEVTDPTTGLPRLISDLPTYDYGFTFSHDLPRLNISYGGELKSGFIKRHYRFNQVENSYIHAYGSLYLEYRPRPGLQCRAELRNIGEDIDRRVSYYDGPRTQEALRFSEQRDLRIGPNVYASIRRAW